MRDEMLTKNEVLEMVKVSRATLYRFMMGEGFPLPVKFGRSNRWHSEEVRGWIKNRPRAALRC